MAFMDLFDKDDMALAKKVLDYYDGESKEYLMKYLQVHRKHALKKGINPRTRNIVKMVADKSGLLFNGKAPVIQVYNGETVDEQASTTTLQIFQSADWVEFFTNFDVVLRMLKTAYVLVQVDPETGQWMFEMLDQHNCAVHLDQFKRLDTLVYCTGDTKEGKTYRVWTNEIVQDLLVDENGNETLYNAQPNPFGIIPAAVFHDTNVPREDAWNEIPEDLVEVNDIYNLHITDSEYAAMWNKQPTLFTNAMIQGGLGGQMVEQAPVYGEALPRWAPSTEPGFVGGPGTVVALETTGGDSVYLEYQAPNVSLMPLDDMVNKWVMDFASDWSVRVSTDGQGSADSGFKLIVQELPNLELRKQRQRMFEAGFKRLYKVIKAVAAQVGISLPEDSELFVKFTAPELPVDRKVTEDIWAARIAGGRASRVDYFMEEMGMSREEAIAKVDEVLRFNQAQAAPRAALQNTTVSV